ncbi:TGF-beta-inducible nuclear protein 1, putative [Eimeria tenella]|uniref:TGF-beta-inducible nuclear protein 1, putative n=1 Tax=Eimeria tenella TaxID=5802 RepID=U6KUM3_EIMTE|nr:TGF-beta-inducible nuclear protein 1, putative [Eimeria tenella]CDJ40049.1 TGF-beta-inducible nuclear protein 1, putative [Eimeria tenella]|eukprot:XP_013230802.1 TGF-beta-inducible nuclear protein 1, putative [Eimeria tenella]
MKKRIQLEDRKEGLGGPPGAPKAAVPAYLLDRKQQERNKLLSNLIKQKRKEKANKWSLPIPKVQALREEEMFKVLRSGKRRSKQQQQQQQQRQQRQHQQQQ